MKSTAKKSRRRRARSTRHISTAGSVGHSSSSLVATPATLSDAGDMRIISENPRIVHADPRLDTTAPYFLYLPKDAPKGEATMVIVDYLHKVEEYAELPVWQKPASVAPSQPCFRITEIPGAGLGLVAARTIKAGELIVSERPIFVMRVFHPFDKARCPPHGDFVRDALSGLSEAARGAVLALKNGYKDEARWDEVAGIIDTNTSVMDMNDIPPTMPGGANPSLMLSGVFPTLSRANHACSPSAHFWFSTQTFEGQFRATRDIAPGEEITTGYDGLRTEREQRRFTLRQKYFFVCKCATCSLPPDLVKQSDARRVRIRELLESDQGSGVTLEMIENGMQDALAEGVYWHYAQLAAIGGMMALQTRASIPVAKKWVQKAKDAYTLIESENSGTVGAFSKFEGMLRTMELSRGG